MARDQVVYHDRISQIVMGRKGKVEEQTTDPALDQKSRFGFLRSLRLRFLLIVMIPILLIMVSMSVMHYSRTLHMLEEQIQMTAVRLGEVVRGSLRHAMLANNCQMVARIITDVGALESINGAQILDLEGNVKIHSSPEQVGQVRPPEEMGCTECHQLAEGTRPASIQWPLSPGVFRISTPINNEPGCAGCHAGDSPHIGLLVADVSLTDIEWKVLNHLRDELLLTAGITALVTLTVLAIHFLNVRRKVAMREPLAKLAAGDFSARMTISPGPIDELDHVARVFNQMAEELESNARAVEERQALRERAIVEERERVGRELHDGLAQILAYVNAKTSAVRLMLQKDDSQGAEEQLTQLEEAARALFGDVRVAVLGLRMTDADCESLTTSLSQFASQFTELSGLPVEMNFDPEVEHVALETETQLHMCRIAQEALSNARRHAKASRVEVYLLAYERVLVMSIIDDGIGFDPASLPDDRWPHLGLSTMRERAEAIGARISMDSNLGTGTTIAVRLPLEQAINQNPTPEEVP